MYWQAIDDVSAMVDDLANVVAGVKFPLISASSIELWNEVKAAFAVQETEVAAVTQQLIDKSFRYACMDRHMHQGSVSSGAIMHASDRS